MKAQTKAITASIVVIALVLSAVSGITYSWFSDSEKAEISVSTAKVYYDASFDAESVDGEGSIAGEGNKFIISNLAAAQKYSIGIKIQNDSTIKTVYRIYVTYENESSGLADYDLKNIFVNGKNLLDNREIVIDDWTTIAVNQNPKDSTVIITTPDTYGSDAPAGWDNESIKSGLTLSVIVEAYQSTYKYPVSIDGVGYSSISEAIAAAETGATITLMTNVHEPISIKDKEITLDLNGKNITMSNPNEVAILVGSGGILTIKGDGYVDGGSGGDNVAVWARDGGTVTINGGDYTVGPDGSGSGNSVIYSYNGKITINGGFFHTDSVYNDKHYVLNQNNVNSSPGTITVHGGTFVDFDPSMGDDVYRTSFVPSGYTTVEQSKGAQTWYTVVKGSGSLPTSQDDVNKGITESTEKDVGLVLPSNSTFTLDNGIANEGANARNVTFIGDGSQTIDVITNAVNANDGQLSYQCGSTFTFENLSIKAGEGSFDGIVCDELIFKDCTITGKLTLYGKATFINCTFENTMANQYSIWTWGGKDIVFENCIFNTNGKAILLYGGTANLTVIGCEFNDRNNGVAGKAAIEVGNEYDASYNLIIKNITVNGFADGKNTGSKLWANKDSMDAEHLSVTLNGEKIQ